MLIISQLNWKKNMTHKNSCDGGEKQVGAQMTQDYLERIIIKVGDGYIA